MGILASTEGAGGEGCLLFNGGPHEVNLMLVSIQEEIYLLEPHVGTLGLLFI